MLRAFGMRLCHLGLSSHLIGDVATPPISSGDLLISSAGPGSFATVDAIVRVATESGDCVVLLTARPDDVKEAEKTVEYNYEAYEKFSSKYSTRNQGAVTPTLHLAISLYSQGLQPTVALLDFKHHLIILAIPKLIWLAEM